MSDVKYAKVLILSMMLIPVWGLTFLDVETSNSFSTLLGLVFSLYCFYVLKSVLPANGIKPILVYLSGPLAYLLLSLVLKPFNWLEFLFSPLLWACVLCFVFLFFQNSPIRVSAGFFIFSCYLYAFHLYPVYKRVIGQNAAQATLSLKSDKSINQDLSLDSLQFLNKEDSLVRLSPNGRPILIETWNEKCGPCLKSIDRLESFIEKNTAFQHIYLYQNFGEVNLTPEQVFVYQKIKNKTKILIDPNNSLFRAAGMTSYPYFLFFDKDGKLVDHFVGFHESLLPATQERLLQNSKRLSN